MHESRISKELSGRVFELTLAVYRVTDFFPQEEALRKHLREKANEVFGGMGEYGYTVDIEREALGILAKIESMRGYLELARGHRFVRSVNITVLMREYDFLADFFMRELDAMRQDGKAFEEKREIRRDAVKKEEPRGAQGAPRKELASTLPLNERQQKILAHLKTVSKAKVSDFGNVFAKVSLKTIQRDLQDLVSKNIIRKEGDKRWTAYYI